jgi:hypothetical protein
MTIEDVADYCVSKDCVVVLGDPAAGFIAVDGGGYMKRHNFARYLALNELSALPSPKGVLEKATTFRVEAATGEKVMTREEFEKELDAFRQKVGA